MAKLLTVVMPALEQLPTGEYSVTIGDDEPHHGLQTFKAASVEELCGKLAMSCQHGTAHIRELTRELADLRGDYELVRDISNLFVGLLLIKHTSGDAPTPRREFAEIALFSSLSNNRLVDRFLMREG